CPLDLAQGLLIHSGNHQDEGHMRITVIGTGYVGLVTGTCFAELGFDVTCVDRDAKKIETLNKGHVPFYEPGLAELVASNLQASRLHFVTDLKDASGADVIFVAVGTPPAADGLPDLTALWDVVDAIGRHAKDALIVLKSTMPPGTAREVARRLPNFEAAS